MKISIVKSFGNSFMVHFEAVLQPNIESIFSKTDDYKIGDILPVTQISLEDDTEIPLRSMYLTVLNSELGIKDIAVTILQNIDMEFKLNVVSNDTYLLVG
ncbi:hypothetical protein [Paenibacillus oleatilyticus]|uniref:Uncharacterized protein n=1 Tax=Paenibacillus oleatilyticus TaxID=2594886 RepID=A0ABV4V8R6_9BACL